MQALENYHRQFVDDALADRQPLKFTQDRRDMVNDFLVSVVTRAAAFRTACSFFIKLSCTPYSKLLQ